MAKFKVGDKVRILDGSQFENCIGWVGSMECDIGKVRTISEIMPYGCKSHFYKLSGNEFVWDERGLELVESKDDSNDKFDWGAFKRGDVTVTFKTNESQRQFLKRCEAHGLRWNSGDRPTKYSYGNSALGNAGGMLVYRRSLYSRPMAYDWDARKYIKRAENTTSDWTAEEIERAKELSHKLLCKIFDEGKYSVVFYLEGNLVRITTIFGDPCENIDLTVRPRGNDKFSPWIGQCVCLCKVTHTPIPKFIMDKNRGRNSDGKIR